MGGFYVCSKNIKIEECTEPREVWQFIKILGFKQKKKIGMTTNTEVYSLGRIYQTG